MSLITASGATADGPDLERLLATARTAAPDAG
jgi:hypothetical protein